MVLVLQVLTLAITPFQQNCRILFWQDSRHCWVVDPGGEVPRILATLRDRNLVVDRIILTHAHIDHGGGVKNLLAQLAATQGAQPELVACGAAEASLRATLSQQAVLFGLSPQEYENVPEPDRIVNDGDFVALEEGNAKVLFTPGHSPGHLAFYFESTQFVTQWLSANGIIVDEQRGSAPVLLGGDALFAGAVGRTDLPGGNQATLYRSIKEKLYTLPGDTIVMCGHGPDTTIETERTTNPFVRG